MRDTACLAASLPNCQAILMFDDLSLIAMLFFLHVCHIFALEVPWMGRKESVHIGAQGVVGISVGLLTAAGQKERSRS